MVNTVNVKRQQTDPNGVSFRYRATSTFWDVASTYRPDDASDQLERQTRDVLWRRRQPFGDRDIHTQQLRELWKKDIKLVSDIVCDRDGIEPSSFDIEPFSWEITREEIKNEARRLLRAVADSFGSDAIIVNVEQEFQKLDVVSGQSQDTSDLQQLWNLEKWDLEMINIVDKCAHEIMQVYLANSAPVMDIATLIAAGERDAQTISIADDRTLVVGDFTDNVFYNDCGSCAAGFFSIHIPHYFALEKRFPERWANIRKRHPMLGYVLSTAYFGPCLQYAILLAGSHDGVKLHKQRQVTGDVNRITDQMLSAIRVTAGTSRIDGLLTLGNPNQRKASLTDAKFLNHGKKVALKVLEALFEPHIVDNLTAAASTQFSNRVMAEIFADLALVQYAGLSVEYRDVTLAQRPMDNVVRRTAPNDEPDGTKPKPSPVRSNLSGACVTLKEMAGFEDTSYVVDDAPFSIAAALGLL